MEEYKCPNCGNPIYDSEALMCHFCGGSLQRAGKGFIGRIRYANQNVWWYFLVFAVLLAVSLFFVRL